jgi:hypothetical protein
MARHERNFRDLICAIANLDQNEQGKLSSWLTSIACPAFRVRRKGNKRFLDHGDRRFIPIDGDDDFLDACKRLGPFLSRLQCDLWLCPFTAIRTGAQEASQSVVQQVLDNLYEANLRLRRFPRRRSDKELNDAIVRLREETLPNGRHRTWKKVRADLKRINNKWSFPKDDTVRIRYQRLKRMQLPPAPRTCLYPGSHN